MLYRVDYSGHTVTPASVAAKHLVFDGTSVWTIDGTTLRKHDPTTMATSSSVASSAVSVHWDGTNLWTLLSDGTLNYVDRTTLVPTSIGNGGNFPGPETPVVSNAARWAIVKIGAHIYALTNAERSVNVFGNPLKPIRVRKVDIATRTVVATIDLQLPSVLALYTDGIDLWLMYSDNNDTLDTLSARQLFWRVDTSGNILDAVDTGVLSDILPVPYTDGDSLIYQETRISLGGRRWYENPGVLPWSTLIATPTHVNLHKLPNPQGAGTHLTFSRITRASFDANATEQAMPTPAAPTAFSSMAAGDTVVLSWTDNTGRRAMYRVERKVGAGAYGTIAVLGPLSASYTDATPPGGGVLLTYRLTAFNARSDSAQVTTSITSPVTDLAFNIDEAGAGHVAYAAVGTDLWSAYDAGGTVYAKKIDSGMSASTITLQSGNVGGQILRLLSDGSYLYTVTSGQSVKGMALGRRSHPTVLLNSSKVLVVGSSSAITSCETYDPAANAWATTGSMNVGRGSHTATLLADGLVLAAGGSGNLASSERYDPDTGLWALSGTMVTGRSFHTATRLQDGKVLVVGGQGASGILSSAELYDPSTGLWASTGALSLGVRSGHTATLLASGKVLIAGGFNSTVFLATCELYDPVAGTFSSTGPLSGTRSDHTATLLANGKVLVAGGKRNNALSAVTELYDPVAGTFSSTGPLSGTRSDHTATLLANGKVLVAGGKRNNALSAVTELYDPTPGTWSDTGIMNQVRQWHTATLLANGRVLMVGGLNGSVALSHADLYDPVGGTWSVTGSLVTARYLHSAVLLGSGKVLVPGGTDPTNVQFKTFELYDPTPATWTANSPLGVFIRKYDLTGSFQAQFSQSVIATTDATVGGGFIWFTFGDKLRKVTTSDMSTVVTVTQAEATINLNNVTYDAGFVYAAQQDIDIGGYTARLFKWDATTDSEVLQALDDGPKYRMAPGFRTSPAANLIFAVGLDISTGTRRRLNGYNQSTFATTVTMTSDTVAWNGVTFDAGTEKVYAVAAGSPGTIRRLTSSLVAEDNKSKNVATGQDDEIQRVNGKVFVTVTDGAAVSGLSILSFDF